MKLRTRPAGSGFAVIAIAMVVLGVAACAEPPGNDPEFQDDRRRPDVLLVTFCTLRADRLGVYGGGELTPNIDSLAQQSLVFRDHYTQASFSGASFATIITGRYPFEHGIYDHPRPLGDENVTLAELFKERGYATGGFLTHTYLRPKWNYLQGLDIYNGLVLRRYSPEALMERPVGRPPKLVGNALRWVAGLEARPYFLWFQTHMTHYFPQAKAPFVSKEDMAAAQGFKRRTADVTPAELMFTFDSLGVSPEERQGLAAVYDGAVMRSDHLLGNLISGLRALDRFANTIVVVTADHGETLGERGLFANHDANLLEPTVRVPLIMRIPGYEPQEIGTTTRHIDLVPTIGSLAGLAVGTDLPGRRMIPEAERQDEVRTALSETRPKPVERGEFARNRLRVPGVEGKIRSIRRGLYKLIVYPTREGADVELFDLEKDPGEMENLAEELPDVTRELITDLEAWFAGYREADTSALELDPEDIESLRSLGYID